jgi:protein subunit release factor A
MDVGERLKITVKHRGEPLFSVSIRDCKVSTFRSGGKGGQHQNKVESGVRVTHEPSGAVGEARDGRDQFRNKINAFGRMLGRQEFQRWLRAQAARALGMGEEAFGPRERRTSQKGEKIRTYHFPRGLATDHRTGRSYDLFTVLEGDLDPIIADVVASRASKGA